MDLKQQKAIDIVSSCLPKVCNGAACYCYGSIPRDKFRNACNEYAGNVDFSECIGLTDETVFGSGKRGFLFTFDGFYYDGCNSKKYYSDGISFNKLSSLYYLSAMNDMLSQLYKISILVIKEPPPKKSGFETFLDVASAFLEGFADLAAEQQKQEEEQKRRQETEDAIEDLKSCKSYMKKFQSMLDEYIDDDYSDMDKDELSDFFGAIFRTAAALMNDRKLYELSEGESPEEEEFDSIGNVIVKVSAMLEVDDEEHEPVYLMRAIESFYSIAASAIIELYDEEKELDDEDLERLFNKGQRAIKKLKKRFKEAYVRINELIEFFKDSLEEEEEE